MNKVGDAKLGKDGRGIGVSIDFNVFGFGEEGAKIEIGKVDSGETFVFADNSIEEDFYGDEGGDGGRNIVVAGKAITTGRTAYAAVDGFCDGIPLFFNHAVIVGRFF